MCGRFALYSDPDRFAQFLDAEVALDPEGWQPSWNVGPTRDILGTSEQPDGRRLLGTYRWGLVPMGAKDPAALRSTFNARAETVATKPTFRSAFRRGRILVPADAFYEWRTVGSVKTPNVFTHADGTPIVFAGLAERWRRPDGSIMRSATIITTGAGPDMAGIHDRMPVVLEARRLGALARPGSRGPGRARAAAPAGAGGHPGPPRGRPGGGERPQRRAGAARRPLRVAPGRTTTPGPPPGPGDGPGRRHPAAAASTRGRRGVSTSSISP